MQHFPEIQLTFQEARVLGCLLEKEILIPGSYPLTHNSQSRIDQTEPVG